MFLVPLLADDRDDVSGLKDIGIKQLKPIDMYLVYGNKIRIKDIYPELRIR
jgi:hypothetical protein